MDNKNKDRLKPLFVPGSAYNTHPSELLNKLYQIKNYQGADPEKAKILFVGRDPNWCYHLENMPVIEKIREYLTDGPEFWKKYNVHHPFLLEDYKGDGRRYHKMFSKIKISPTHSNEISFIELIGFPTTGMAKKFKEVYISHLLSDGNYMHLVQLDSLLSSKDKKIFIAWGLLDDFSLINKKLGLFKDLSAVDRKQLDINDLNQINNIFIHKHFSDSISNSTLSKISQVVKNHLK